MNTKLPSFQFYPADWRKDPAVQSLSFHDRGVWFEIILLMHESEQRGKLLLNGNAMPEEALARILGLDKQNLEGTLTNILTYGVASRCDETGALMCRRMIRDEKIRQIRKEAGKLGGNPALVKQNSTTEDKQNPTPSSSSSYSSSDKVGKTKKKGALSLSRKSTIQSWEASFGKLSIEHLGVWVEENNLSTDGVKKELEIFRNKCEAKGYEYVNFPAAFKDWGCDKEKCKKKVSVDEFNRLQREKWEV